jgi:hypothetical protein
LFVVGLVGDVLSYDKHGCAVDGDGDVADLQDPGTRRNPPLSKLARFNIHHTPQPLSRTMNAPTDFPNKKSRGFSVSGIPGFRSEVLETGREPPRVAPLDP